MSSVKVLLKNTKEYKFKPFTLREHIPKGDENPRGRSGHRIVSDISCVYSYGGYNPALDSNDERLANGTADDLKLFRELWKFNIAKGEWKKMDYYSSSLPKQAASNAVILRGNLLIIHGGTGFPFGNKSTHQTYVTDLKRDTSLKRLHTRGNHPPPQYGQAVVLCGHCLYVVGGTTGYEYFTDVHCLDLKTKIWEETYISKGLSNLEPLGRYRHEVALYNSRIIIFGGGTDQYACSFEDLPAFNIETKKWEILSTTGDTSDSVEHPSFPFARMCHASVQIPEDGAEDSKFIICGGYDGFQIRSDVWILNLRTLEWKKCRDMTTPLYFHSASLSPTGQMFIFGGIYERGDGHVIYKIRSNKMYSTWVVIPKLKELCWDAFLYYNPNISRCPSVTLLNIGVPKEFVERLES